MESLAMEIHQYQGFPLEWRLTSDGQKVIKAQDACLALGWSNKLAAKKMDLVFPDYKFQSSFGKAERPSWYLFEPGFFQLCFEAKTDQTIKLQRFVFELLPKLFRGEYALVSSPAQAISVALPETSESDRLFLLHRNTKVKEVYDLYKVHEVLNYRVSGFPSCSDWYSGLVRHYMKLFGKNLIYGHDYYFDQGMLYLTYVGLEYLLPFARPKQDIHPEYIGMVGALLVFEKFRHFAALPASPNGFRPSFDFTASALMKCGQVNEWYPISLQGLEMLEWINYREWEYKNSFDGVAWRNMNALVATLNTTHWIWLPFAKLDTLFIKGELSSKICRMLHPSAKMRSDVWADWQNMGEVESKRLRDNFCTVHQHPGCGNLYQLRSVNCQLLPGT